MKNKLSVAIAVFNEEKNIGKCLKSVKSIADEIIVVDGKSSDKTAEIAKSLGAKVILVENKAMFHINKNIAIRNCSNPWILLLDADERVSQALAQEITDIISHNPAQNAFFINRKNWFLGGFLKKGGVYPDRVIRLFRQKKGILPEVSVHEQLKVEGEVGYLEKDLIHFADPNFARYLQRSDRYSSVFSTELEDKKEAKNLSTLISFYFLKPLKVFMSIYFRHKGFQDGFRGFVWALFSSSQYFFAYSKYFYNTKKT